MSRNKKLMWAIVPVAGVGLIATAVLAMWGYMAATATPIHPRSEDVPSVTRSMPAKEWALAAEQGRQLVRAAVKEQNLPGVSVAVGLKGDLVWQEGFGWADLENKVPVAPETLFRVGTASKALTSAAVGLLVEQGKLKLDDEIQTYVPAYRKKEWPLTLRQLMAHTGGVRNDGGDEEPLSVHCTRTAEGIRRFEEDALRFEPGTQYRNSNYGWILVSAAVEAAASEPFFAFMRRQVFEPLGMNHTREDDATLAMSDRSQFYFPRFAADPRYGPQEPRDVDYSCFAGSAGFLSTASDLARFLMAVNGGKVVQPATVQMLQTSERLKSGEETGYGLGWDLGAAELAGKQTPVVGHDGELMGGRVISFWTFPEHGIVVTVASNTAYAETFTLAVRIAEAFARR